LELQKVSKTFVTGLASRTRGSNDAKKIAETHLQISTYHRCHAKSLKKYFLLGPGLSRFLCPSKDINFICVVILDKGDWSLLHACHPFTLNSNFRIDFKMFDF